MIYLIVSTILFGINALLAGSSEAHYYDYAYISDRGHKNLHPNYFVRALIVGLFATAGAFNVIDTGWIYEDLWLCFIYLLGLALIYPFLHDGMFYKTRNKLNSLIYQKGWWSNKIEGEDKKKAKMEFKVTMRTAMFIIGILFIIGIILEINA